MNVEYNIVSIKTYNGENIMGKLYSNEHLGGGNGLVILQDPIIVHIVPNPELGMPLTLPTLYFPFNQDKSVVSFRVDTLIGFTKVDDFYAQYYDVALLELTSNEMVKQKRLLEQMGQIETSTIVAGKFVHASDPSKLQ